MITAAGCRARRERILNALGEPGPIVLGDTLHLRYFVNCHIDPFSLGADYGALLVLEPNGAAVLHYDHRLPKTSFEKAHAETKVAIPWYDGQSPGRGPRRMILHDVLQHLGGRIHDSLSDPLAPRIHAILHEQRRSKDADELDQHRKCCRIAEVGFDWARKNVKPGMTEVDVYAGIAAACTRAAGQAVIVYGDFAVSPGSQKRGGAPTQHVLNRGETLILDYSVVLQGYRSDFTNTLVVGGSPSRDQTQLFDLCVAAMEAGEKKLIAGASCQSVYDAVAGVFEAAGMKSHFPHHAGHGLGLAHPEPPYIVARSTESLIAGDVVTLEPGLYVDGIGGIRIEHNYAITPGGYERLSQHTIALV